MKLSSVLRYIEKETGSVLSIHNFHPAFLDCESLRLAPDQYLHHGEFCRFNKMHGDFDTCVKNKTRSLKLAQKGKCFSGACPFGIWDFAHPVLFQGELIAVIYLGYFLCDRPLPPEWKGTPPEPITDAKKEELRRYGDFLDRFIRLETAMWIQSGGMDGKQRTAEYYVKNTMFFIDCNFSKDISIENAADTLRVTPNYLGEVIKKQTNQNFRRILNARRIREAKVYLRLHKVLSITRIASICGFTDSNYFSTVFHKHTGMTPKEFRLSENSPD